MSKKTSSAMTSPEIWPAREWIASHFRNRPFSLHFVAWMLVGISFGLLLAPNFRLVSIFAFGMSGCISCGILALLTYPVSEHYRLIVAGAMAGSAMIPLCSLFSPVPMANIAAPLCLMIGAMVGATGIIWLSPLRIWTLWANREVGQPD